MGYGVQDSGRAKPLTQHLRAWAMRSQFQAITLSVFLSQRVSLIRSLSGQDERDIFQKLQEPREKIQVVSASYRTFIPKKLALKHLIKI